MAILTINILDPSEHFMTQSLRTAQITLGLIKHGKCQMVFHSHKSIFEENANHCKKCNLNPKNLRGLKANFLP